MHRTSYAPRAFRRAVPNPIRLLLLLVCLHAAFACCEPQAAGSAMDSPLPAGLSDDEWMRRAMDAIDAQAASPDVETSAFESSDREITFSYRIARPPSSGNPVVALVVPPGALTSGSLAWADLVPHDGTRPPASAMPRRVDTATSGARVELEPFGHVRNMRIARVALPVSLPSHPHERIVAGRVRLCFAAPQHGGEVPASGRAWADGQARGVLRGLVEKLVRNPQDIGRFCATSPLDTAGPAAPPPPWQPEPADGRSWFRMRVQADGLYRIPIRDVIASCPAFRPETARLYLDGIEQPLLPVPEEQPLALLFHGHANESRYSTENVYWLRGGPGHDGEIPPARMKDIPAAARGAAPARAENFQCPLVVEEDTRVITRNDQFLTILGYRWIWEELTSGTAFTCTFDAPGLAGTSETLSAKAVFYAHTWAPGSSLRVDVRINGTEVCRFHMASESADTASFTFPSGLLRATGNRLALELNASVPAPSHPETAHAQTRETELLFDRLELAYPRRYEMPSTATFEFRSPEAMRETEALTAVSKSFEYAVSTPSDARRLVALDITDTAPLRVRLEDAKPGGVRFTAREKKTRRYLLADPDETTAPLLESAGGSGWLRDGATSADYLVIAHPDFIPGIEPYAAALRARGFTPAIVSVQDIYDQFSFGQLTPEAIRSFIRHAADNWQPTKRDAPAAHVLLVGDATSAYRNQFRNQVVNLVPTLSSEGAQGMSERYASDEWFVQVCGNDLLSDTLLGRFSVNSCRDLATVVSKNLAFTTASATGPWRNTLGFVADHSEFENAVNRIMESVPPRFFQKRIFLAEEPWIDNYYFPAEIADAKRAKVSPTATTRIRDMFNDGASVVTFFGHGSPNVWSNERIWFGGESENSDNLLLSNIDRLAFVINMTCNSGAIDYPMPRWHVCISEDMLRTPRGGAIACFVPSGPGITSHHEQLTRHLVRALLHEQTQPLKAAMLLGSLRYLLERGSPEMVRMFIYLGDPALNLDLAGKWEQPRPAVTMGPEAVTAALPPGNTGNAWAQIIPRDHDGEAGDITAANAASPNLRLALPRSGLGAGARTVFMKQTPAGPPVSVDVPLETPDMLRVTQWSLSPLNPARAGEEVTATLRIAHTGRLPIRAMKVMLLDSSGKTCATSEPRDALPGTLEFTAKFPAQPGLARYAVACAAADSAVRQLPSDTPLIVVCPRPPDAGTPPVEIDAQSVTTTYARRAGTLAATVKMKIYNVSDTTVTDLKAGLVGAGGQLVDPSVVTIPPIPPGEGVPLEMTANLDASAPADGRMGVRLDPHHARADSKNWPITPVDAAPGRLGDLAILPGAVEPSTTSPIDGQTVFFRVTVENRGATPLTGVRMEAYDGPTTASPRIDSRVQAPQQTTDIDAHSSAVFSVRWDPFRNAGKREILFRAFTETNQPELRTDNNQQTLKLRVRTKYRLKVYWVGVPPRSPEDRRDGVGRFIARVENLGESPAHGVKVVYYATRERRPGNILGEEIVEEVPAMGSRDVTLRYKLKPGDEKRQFQPFVEAFLKGSLQRVSSQ